MTTKKTKAIFFIEAPFQLISVYEAIFTFSLEKSYVLMVRMSGNEENDSQLRKVVSLLFNCKEKIHYIYIKNQNKTFKDYLKIVYYVLKLSITQIKYNYVFIGNIESGFLSLLVKFVNRDKIFLLDDGVKNLINQNNFSNADNYNMFTMLTTIKPLIGQSIKYNSFKNIKNITFPKTLSSKLDKEITLFLGSKIVELDVISKSSYLEYLQYVLDDSKEDLMIYIPHRGEKLDKLKDIKIKYSNFYIQHLDLPIELYQLDDLPIKSILSFYSAALISLKLKYPDKKIYYLPFKYKKYGQSIDIVYSSFASYGINSFLGHKNV
jgi:hypothetical protein